MKMRRIVSDNIRIGAGEPLVLIAGPCVIENGDETRRIALALKEMTSALSIPLVFKASYDKANRTSFNSYRGPGLEEGLRILESIRRDLDIPILSDVHRFEEIEAAAQILDVVQIPAFLCRQTDFIMEVARRAKIINIKKGQFLAPWDIGQVLEKARAAGNDNILITERGTCFGYNNLVTDMRSLPILRNTGFPVVFDGTHSVQFPGGMGSASGGDREMVPYLCRAAVAVGIDGLFLEVHPEPDKARCDGPNSLRLDSLPGLLKTLREIDLLTKGTPRS